jgi:hypothetical protein
MLSVPCIAQAQDEPKASRTTPGDVTAITREHLIAVVPNFFYFDYPFQPQPGKRLWLRVDDEHWIERYPDGTESKFKILGRTIARGESGTVVGKIEGDPSRTSTGNDGTFQVFIPDKGNKELAILMRYAGQGKSEWLDMSWSEKRKTEIKKVE